MCGAHGVIECNPRIDITNREERGRGTSSRTCLSSPRGSRDLPPRASIGHLNSTQARVATAAPAALVPPSRCISHGSKASVSRCKLASCLMLRRPWRCFPLPGLYPLHSQLPLCNLIFLHFCSFEEFDLGMVFPFFSFG